MSKMDGCVICNLELVKKYGTDIALFLSELVSEMEHIEQSNALKDGFFEYTARDFEKNTGLTRRKQDRIIKKLTELDLIEVMLKGIPPKRYFKLNETELSKYFSGQAVKKDLYVSNRIHATKYEFLNSEQAQQFEYLWSLYPKRVGKQEAAQAYKKALRSGEQYKVILKGVISYANRIKEEKIPQKYQLNGSSFFVNQRWHDDYTTDGAENQRKKFLPAKVNKFANFRQREWNFLLIEKQAQED